MPAPAGIQPADWPQIAALFDEGAELPPPARAAWLEQLRRRAPALQEIVARLLVADEAAAPREWLERGPALSESALQAQAALEAATGRGSLAPGDCLGPYRLLERVASGGMGEVWRAEATDLPVPRVVALKLPLWHRPGSAAATRFAREAQILAGLEHPHIARLYAAAQAADGTPYLAMEWIHGQTLMQWCANCQPSLPERLQVFMQVLTAVAFAHGRGVLHRDLKPSNLMVDQQGQVKLLDFGIAKLLDDEGNSPATELTRQAGQVMTRSYAAPEQLQGQSLSPATDVYALGVILFELLTRQRPYRLALPTAAQLEQAIVAGDVRRASALDRRLRGDLDAILACALSPQPALRYSAAQAFADDLQRHLRGLPVLARPESLRYLIGRFVHRHRGLAVGSAAVALALLLGLGLAAREAWRADRERDRALAAAARTESTARFLLDLLDDAAKAGQPITVGVLMQRAEQLARHTLDERPDELALVLGMVGSAERDSRDAARGLALLNEAAGIAKDPSLQAELRCTALAAQTVFASAKDARAEINQIIDSAQTERAARRTCQLTLARLLIQSGELEAARRLLATAAPAIESSGSAGWREQTWATAMQTFLAADGQGQGADARAAATMALLQRLGRDRNSLALGLFNTWGTLAMVSGEPLKAAERYAAVVTRMEGDHPEGGIPPYPLTIWGSGLLAGGDYSRAAEVLERAAQAAQAQGVAAMQFSALCLRGRAAALQGQANAAQAWFDRALAVPDRGEPLRRNAQPFCDMARAEAWLLTGATAPARALLQQVLSQAYPASVKLSANLLAAEVALAEGQRATANRLASAAEAEARRLQADNTWSARVGTALALRSLASEEPAEARRLMQQANEHLQATVLPGERWHTRVTQALR